MNKKGSLLVCMAFLITGVLVGGLYGFDVKASSCLDYEARFVYRGSQRADKVMIPKFELSGCFVESDMLRVGPYIGAWGVMTFRNTKNVSAQQFNPYGGLLVDCQYYSGDAGIIHYEFTGTDDGFKSFLSNYTSRQDEVYLGLNIHCLFNPSVYIFYNFELQQMVLEGSIMETLCMMRAKDFEFLISGEVKFGWLRADRFNGDQRNPMFGKQFNQYLYAKAELDVTLCLNECISISFGPRLFINNDGDLKATSGLSGDPFSANAFKDNNYAVWVGLKVAFSH